MVSPRILLSDDHRLLRAGLKSLLEKNGFEIAAEAGDGRSAVEIAKKIRPDLVLLDVTMPLLNGIEASKQIHTEVPKAKIVVMSMHAASHFVLAAFHAGAAGYLLKDSAFDELLVAIRAVLNGHVYLSPAVAGFVVNASMRQPSARRALLHRRISSRETEVLQLLVEGKSTREIASILYVSAKTIETHRKQIMERLKLDSVAALTKFCVREGLTSL
jgi:DNA-binding NarL/FixJ family response regulator